MSRNKDIEFYHNVSGLSYKECRANLKAAHWDLSAIFFPKLSELTESCKSNREHTGIQFRCGIRCLQEYGKCFKRGGDECL